MDQLSIKVKIHLKDINVTFTIKLEHHTTFRNILEVIYEGQFYENFNKSEYCALFYRNKYIQDRDAKIIREFQLKSNELKSQIISQNQDIETLEFIRNQEFTNRLKTSEEARMKDQNEQSQIRLNQEQRVQNNVKANYQNQGQTFHQNMKDILPEITSQDLRHIQKIEEQSQPQYDDQVIQNSNIQNDNIQLNGIDQRVPSQSQIKPQQQKVSEKIDSKILTDNDLLSAQFIKANIIQSEIQNYQQLQLIRFVSLNSLRVDIDDFESIRTVHLIGYENYNLNNIRDFILLKFNLNAKYCFIKFNENEVIDQSANIRIAKNYIRLYLHEKQIRKYSIQYNFNIGGDQFQFLFNDILLEGLENEQINKQYNINQSQLIIKDNTLVIGVQQNTKTVKQYQFVFQYQSLVIFKYELKQLTKSDADPIKIFEDFFRSKFNFKSDKNNYWIEI